MANHILADAIYARYMREWLRSLALPVPPEFTELAQQLDAYWEHSNEIDLEAARERLWAWVDVHGGPGWIKGRSMLAVRMLLCLAHPQNRELQDEGFFDDLVQRAGQSRETINRRFAEFKARFPS